MKTIPVIISIIALALSGCAYTGYRHDYAGYNGGYTVQRYYDYGGYDRSYYRPGTSFSYERSYVYPSFDHHRREYEHHQDSHRGWQQPSYFGGGHGDRNGRQDRGMGREFVPGHRYAEQAPNWAVQPQHRQPPMSEPRRHDFGGNRGRQGDAEHSGWRRGHTE